MVLVSKLRGSSSMQQHQGAASTSSLFSKIRSTLTRSSSNTSLVQVVSPVSANDRHLYLQLDVKGATSLSGVERFDQNTPSGSNPPRRRNKSPDRPHDNTVRLGDFQAELSVPENRMNPASFKQSEPSASICGSHDDAAAIAAGESDVDTEPVSPTPVVEHFQGSEAVEPCQGEISGEKPCVAKPERVKPGSLWKPSEPPAHAHPAWQFNRDKETATSGTKTRFPTRLPPLSGIACKSLRRLSSSTPVLEVSELPQSPSRSVPVKA